MWKLRLVFRKRRAFSLIEVLLWISLFSLLFMSFFHLFDYCSCISHKGDLEDEILSNVRYGIEYIKDEILKADMIIPIDEFIGSSSSNKEFFNFVILNIGDLTKENPYNYATYFLRDNELIRAARNWVEKLPAIDDLDGNNQVCCLVQDIDRTRLDRENKSIYLSFSMGDGTGKNHRYSTRIAVKCPILESLGGSL